MLSKINTPVENAPSYTNIGRRDTPTIRPCVGVITSQDIELEIMRLLSLDKQQKILNTEQNNLNIEQRNLKLKIKLQKMDKIDAKTFKAVNKILMERSSNTMTNSTVNSNNSNCNTQIIKYTFTIFQISHLWGVRMFR